MASIGPRRRKASNGKEASKKRIPVLQTIVRFTYIPVRQFTTSLFHSFKSGKYTIFWIRVSSAVGPISLSSVYEDYRLKWLGNCWNYFLVLREKKQSSFSKQHFKLQTYVSRLSSIKFQGVTRVLPKPATHENVLSLHGLQVK